MLTSIKRAINGARTKIAEIINPAPPPISVHDIFLDMLKKYPIVSVLVDTRATGVILPQGLYKEEMILLQYGLNLAHPIPDLKVGSDGISATLRFGREPFQTFIPWDAIKGMGPGKPGPVGPGTGNSIVLKGGKYTDMQNRGSENEGVQLKVVAA